MRVADARIESTAVQIRASARTLGARLAAARAAALFYRDTILPLRRQILDESLKAYNAMSIGAFQLFAAKRAEVEAERAAVDALREYWSVRAQVDALGRGRLPKGALTMPSTSGPASATGGDAGGH
jgi:outer membrane protein TolC